MEAKYTRTIRPVKAPCMIVYAEQISGKMELRPYIDVNKKRKIWGVAIDGLAFKKTHEADGDWNRAMDCREEKFAAFLPTTTQLDVASRHIDCFNEVIKQLRECYIEAEYWRDGWYWSREEQGDNAVMLDMSTGLAELMSKRFKNGYVRLATYKPLPAKLITLPYALLYMENGYLQPRLGFEPDKKDLIWGLRIGKNADICLKKEAKPLNWYQAQEKAMKISNDKVRYSLPSKEVVEQINDFAGMINDTLAVLQSYGVVVDFVNKGKTYKTKYLTATECGEYFLTHENEMVSKECPCECRYVAYNV